MKKIVLILLIAMVSLFAEDIQWAKSFEDAKKQSGASGKLVMLMLTQDGCAMCEYMKFNVLKNQDVVGVVESRFVPVEIDIHKGKVPDGFKAYGTPTIYFIDANGNKVGRQMVGAAKPEAFIELLQKVKK